MIMIWLWHDYDYDMTMFFIAFNKKQAHDEALQME